MSSDQNKLIGAIRELVQRENNSPSDSDLDAFVKLLQTDKHGEAILSSLLEAQKVSSTSKEFDYEDDDWEHQFRCKTPAVARFFATWTIGLLEVIAPEIKKEAKAKVTVWPAGVIPLVTTSGTLYYNAVEELNGPCDVTVNGSGKELKISFWRSGHRFGKRERGQLIALFVGEVDAATQDVKTFEGEGDATWEDLGRGFGYAA